MNKWIAIVIALVLYYILALGFAIPKLFSAADWLLIGGGVLLLIFSIVVLPLAVWNYWKKDVISRASKALARLVEANDFDMSRMIEKFNESNRKSKMSIVYDEAGMLLKGKK